MTASSGTAVRTALGGAARAALLAPSVRNTQPWQWLISGATLTLRADRTRQVPDTDPEARLLLLSCGAALHHARTALAANGWTPVVRRLPDSADPDLLATLEIGEPGIADPHAHRLTEAMPRRRTDRRPFADVPVPGDTLEALNRLVWLEGAYLHLVRPDQAAPLAATGGRDGRAGLESGPGTDRGTAYVVVFGMARGPLDLLRGGEALSALLLEATARGLATAPLCDAVAAGRPRDLLRGLLAGPGEPFLAVRLGHRAACGELPPVPRRPAGEVVTGA